MTERRQRNRDEKRTLLSEVIAEGVVVDADRNDLADALGTMTPKELTQYYHKLDPVTGKMRLLWVGFLVLGIEQAMTMLRLLEIAPAREAAISEAKQAAMVELNDELDDLCTKERQLVERETLLAAAEQQWQQMKKDQAAQRADLATLRSQLQRALEASDIAYQQIETMRAKLAKAEEVLDAVEVLRRWWRAASATPRPPGNILT